MVLCRAEGQRGRRHERVRMWAAFIANPFKFTKKLLGRKPCGRLVWWQAGMLADGDRPPPEADIQWARKRVGVARRTWF